MHGDVSVQSQPAVKRLPMGGRVDVSTSGSLLYSGRTHSRSTGIL